MKFSITLWLLVCLTSAFGQDLIINLYDGEPPYSTGIKTQEEWVDFRVHNVQIPQLYVYKAKPENSTGVSVIYCPGGGYRVLAIPDKGKAYGEYFNDMGVTAIILKYRLPISHDLEENHKVPFTDVVRAMKVVKSMSAELGVDPDKIGIMGGSAGGHLASTISTRFDDAKQDSGENVRPYFSILVYPVITMNDAFTHQGSKLNLLGTEPVLDMVQKYSNELNVSANTPPTFIVHGANDSSVSVINSIKYYEALIKNKVPVEMHTFQEGKHGAGMRSGYGTWSDWPVICRKWLETYILQDLE